MAGFNDVRTSDQLFREEENLIRAITKRLQFNYICSPVSPDYAQPNLAAQPGGHSILKNAYRTLPQSLGFPAWDSRLSLVCMTSTSKAIFWDYVAEALDLNTDAMSWSDDEGVVIQLSAIRGLPTSPPHISTLRILYTQQSQAPLYPSLAIKSNLDTIKEGSLAKIYDSQVISGKLSTVAAKVIACDRIALDHEALDSAGDDQGQERLFFKVFRSGYLQLRHWAHCTGILKGQFDMMTDEMLLHQFIEALDQLVNADIPQIDETSILQAALSSNEFVYPRTIPTPYGGRLSVNLPSGHASHTVSSESTRAFTAAIKTTDYGKMLPTTWAQAGRRAFLDNHESFLALEARCWIPKMKTDFAKALPAILVRLQTHFRNSDRRVLLSIWPYSISSAEDQQEGENVYVLGVYRFNEEHLADAEYLNALCQQYMPKLKYDQNSAALSCRVASKEEVALLLPNSNAEQESMSSTPSAKEIAQAPAQLMIEGAKFRTASAAMDRLRWDPKHASLDYEVGYVDRFAKDLMWKSLDVWEKMTEEEEFVPEHRIQKIRRKPEGVVVWDREKRFDGTGG